MAARVLTDEEYAKLAAKLDTTASQLKQVHRLLCDGHKVEELTPAEQRLAAVFEAAICVQIPNDYGWEPGIEVEDVEAVQAPAPKPKKNGK